MPARFRLFAVVAALLPAAAGTVGADEAPRISLRIEAGAHLQRVENLFYDAARSAVVSTSTDGTVRRWDAQNGHLLRTIVLPILGDAGTDVDKAGLSPRGNLLAVGVHPRDAAKKFMLALYDARSENPPKLVPLSEQASAIAFSPDERYVAIATWDEVNVYRLPQFEVVATDIFHDVVWGLDFDTNGRLVAGSFAGEVRLYDAVRFWPIAKTTTSAGTEIVGIRFAPDGSRIAVGFNTGSGIDILAGHDLARLVGLAPPQTGYVGFPRVAWSPDGTTVFALESLSDREEAVLSWNLADHAGGWRSWLFSAGAQRLHRTTASALNFMPLLSGESVSGFALGMWNGDVYAVDAAGKNSWSSPRVKGYFDEPQPTALLVSEHGDIVEFALGHGADTRFRIDLNAPEVTPSRSESASLRPPILTSPRMVINELSDFSRAAVNGNKIDFDRWESISGGAVAPDDSALVIGTRFALRKIGPDGKTIWRIDPGSEIWAVNVTGDSRFAVAALGDGTIRWFNIKNGDLALSLFVHADRKRWAAWTPSAEFYAPPGSEDLVTGYRLDPRGNASPSPVPLAPEAMRASRYRPDLFAAMLSPKNPDLPQR